MLLSLRLLKACKSIAEFRCEAAGVRIKCIAIVHSGSAENMNKLLEASRGGEGFNLGEFSLTETRLQGFSHLAVKGQIRV